VTREEDGYPVTKAGEKDGIGHTVADVLLAKPVVTQNVNKSAEEDASVLDSVT
jgi:hypothetical protein